MDTNLDQEYYVMKRGRGNDNPLLTEVGVFPAIFGKGVKLPESIVNTVWPYRFAKPLPDNPVMTDYHSSPEPIISSRFKEILKPLNIFGTHLVPVTITTEDQIYHDYFLLHVYLEIECVDRINSVLDIDEDDDYILDIYSLKLNQEVLQKIPLEKRLIFALKESTSTRLVHKSIKELIESAGMGGVAFFRVDRWGTGSVFN